MNKILIIKHGSLGDIVSATSVLKDIRDHFSKAEIVILTTEQFHGFLLDSFLTDNVLIDDRKGIKYTLKLITMIVKSKFDLIIDLQNSMRTKIYGMLFRLLSNASLNGTHLFSTIRYRYDINKPPSVIDGLSNQVEMLGIKCRRKPYLDWLNKNKTKINQIVEKKYIIINPGCSKKSIQKRWPAENYLEICKYLNNINILPVLIGTKDDEKEIEKISNQSSNVLNLCNKSPLPVIYEIAQKAIGTISNDTGPAHLIAATGCKIHLILSSFSNIETVIPRGQNVTFTQKQNINNITANEIIDQVSRIFRL